MSHRPLLSSALASVIAMGLLQPASAHAEEASKNKEKCYGIVKAGQNSCANLSGTHTCAGEAMRDNEPAEWKLVPKGRCAKMGGMSAEQAKAKMAQGMGMDAAK